MRVGRRFPAAVLRRYTLLLGSCNNVASITSKIGPRVAAAAALPKTSSNSSPWSVGVFSGYPLLWTSHRCPWYYWSKFTPVAVRSICTGVHSLAAEGDDNPPEEAELRWFEIGTAELVDMLKQGDIKLFDVREPEELVETGRIPQAVNLPLGEVEAALKMSPQAFQQKYGAPKPAKEDADIVFHCRSGVRSHQAMEIAHLSGYRKARNYLPSWLGWVEYLESQKKEKS